MKCFLVHFFYFNVWWETTIKITIILASLYSLSSSNASRLHGLRGNVLFRLIFCAAARGLMKTTSSPYYNKEAFIASL